MVLIFVAKLSKAVPLTQDVEHLEVFSCKSTIFSFEMLTHQND